jgi:CBS domain-containing protein
MHTLEQVLRKRSLVAARPDEVVLEALRRMVDARVGAIAVLEGERLCGVFSERDLMTRVVVAGRDPAATRLEEVMTREVATAQLHESRAACLERMQRHGCRHLPVLSGDRVITMLSMRDLLHDEIDEQFDEIRHLRAYVFQTPPA